MSLRINVGSIIFENLVKIVLSSLANGQKFVFKQKVLSKLVKQKWLDLINDCQI